MTDQTAGRLAKDGGVRMDVVFSGPIKGVCACPALWVESSEMSYPLVYFQKPKWVKDDTAWEKFLRSVFANARLDVWDRDALREVLGRIFEEEARAALEREEADDATE